jgi:predicted GNAT family acetyltransferase
VATEIRVRRFAEVGDFLDTAGDFLVAREAEHNLIFGICSGLRETPERYGEPYLAVVERDGNVVAAAIQTPPFRLVLSEVDDPAAIEAIVEDVFDRGLPGVTGPAEHTAAFAAVWNARGGPTATLHMSERIYRLTAVRAPRPVAGHHRMAIAADRGLAIDWTEGFMRDAFGDVNPTEVAADVDRWLARRGRTLYLWEDGEPLSLCGVGGETPNGIRIGPVYTPPALRGRGYASALVAAVSQDELNAGRRFCFLFTDQANPTANHIYQAIGYELIRDVDAYRFARP